MRNILRMDSFEHAFELGSNKSVKKTSPAVAPYGVCLSFDASKFVESERSFY